MVPGSDGGLAAQIAQAFTLNLLLSVDNAVAIALALRALRPRQQRWALLLGALAASAARVALTLSIVFVAALPWMRCAGALVLIWIAVKLLRPAQASAGDGTALGVAPQSVSAAIRYIVIADFTLSFDNALAVYAAAQGNWLAIAVALPASIVLVMFASRALLALLHKLPWLVWLGGALIGFVAGQLLLTEPAVQAWLEQRAGDALRTWRALAGVAGAALVLLLAWRRRGAV
jgi:YjbE family integral membrane protein